MSRRQNVVIKLSLTRAEMLEFRKYVWHFRQERRERIQREKEHLAYMKIKSEALTKYAAERAIYEAESDT